MNRIGDWLNQLLTNLFGTYHFGTNMPAHTEGGLIRNILGKDESKLVGDYTAPKSTSEMTPTPLPTSMPTQAPTAAPTQMPTPMPTPTLVPGMPQNPHQGYIDKYFPQNDRNRATNVEFGESSFNPNMVHINKTGESLTVEDVIQLQNLIDAYGSVDVGSFQHNMGTPVGEALLEYMAANGLTLADLLNPEVSTRLASDRVYGKVPRILPGWNQFNTPYAR